MIYETIYKLFEFVFGDNITMYWAHHTAQIGSTILATVFMFMLFILPFTLSWWWLWRALAGKRRKNKK